MTVPTLEARGLRKSYPEGDGGAVHVLDGADLAVQGGEFVAIIGSSGAGKSTLLHLLGALDRPTGGEVLLEGRSFTGASAAALAEIRNRKIGFVFQFHHLLREFSALENTMFPLLIAGAPEAVAAGQATELLVAVGLGDRLTHRPAALSGGEQQRVAVARALIARPALILADEPSGNLDAHNGELLHGIFASLTRQAGTAVVVVTHNPALAARADRVLTLHGGQLAAAAEHR
ncbi:MAG: ABC transporter ATP-binding protein [Gemmatimonadales bacterium]